jgi:hypothetical protein
MCESYMQKQGSPRNGPRSGVSILRDSFARGKGRVRFDQGGPYQPGPSPAFGTPAPPNLAPQIGPNEPGFRGDKRR